MAIASKFTVALIKNRWREITIAILAVVSYFALSRKPEIKEVVKVEYVDRVVEKIVTVEKVVVKYKKQRTTVEKPDGTKIVTEIDESAKTEENNIAVEKKKEERKNVEIVTETQSKSRYNLGISAKLYPDTEYSAGAYMRLGDFPLMIGPVLYVRTGESVQISYGVGLQIEI